MGREEELREGEKLFVDGSSRVVEGKRRSGYAIVDGKTLRVLESGPLSNTWSAQACELYAVLQALKRLQGKEGTIYTEFPKVGRYKYVLVIIDHLTHYVEAFPTTKATAQVVTKILLEQIIPRYGVTEVIDSDQGPHFTSRITRNIAEALGIKWEEHTPWHPQSSGRVERMNGELKKQLAKLTLETKLSWIKCIPLALLNLRAQPRADIGISPFEMLYGMPYDAGTPKDHPGVLDKNIQAYITELMKYKQELWKKGQLTQRPPLDITLHRIKPGDWVLIKTWRETTLQPRWEGPYLVLLTTNTAIRTAEKGWTHASRVKGPVQNHEWRVTSPAGDLKVKLSRNPPSRKMRT